MSLTKYYQTLYIVSTTEQSEEDEWSLQPATQTKKAFKGLIQPVSVGTSFINGKDGEFIPATLKTSPKTVIVEKDLVEDTDGTRYIVGKSVGMPLGVTGIKPKRGQHSEYSLTYSNESL